MVSGRRTLVGSKAGGRGNGRNEPIDDFEREGVTASSELDHHGGERRSGAVLDR